MEWVHQLYLKQNDRRNHTLQIQEVQPLFCHDNHHPRTQRALQRRHAHHAFTPILRQPEFQTSVGCFLVVDGQREIVREFPRGSHTREQQVLHWSDHFNATCRFSVETSLNACWEEFFSPLVVCETKSRMPTAGFTASPTTPFATPYGWYRHVFIQ